MFSRIFRIGIRSQSTIRHATPPKPPTGVKKLIQQYGYSALGVYLGISLLDIPLCFMVVHSAGEETIREYQDKVKAYFGYGKDETDKENDTGVKSSTLVTEFALAYAVHKSLIFVRLPIAAAITPWVVKRLLAWGFKVGPNAPKAAAKLIKNATKIDPTSKK